MIKLKWVEIEGNIEDVEYYKLFIMDFDVLIGEEEQIFVSGRCFKLVVFEEGIFVVKVLKNELKKQYLVLFFFVNCWGLFVIDLLINY